jgi:hypothetical protein
LVTDGDDHGVAAEAAIQVNAALEVTTSSLPAVVAGTAYTTTLAASGGITPYTRWSVTDGTLPAGLRLDADSGTVAGTPTGPAGTRPVTLTVTDAAGATATLTLTAAAPATRPQGPPPGSWVQPVVVVLLGLNGTYHIPPPGLPGGNEKTAAWHRYLPRTPDVPQG